MEENKEKLFAVYTCASAGELHYLLERSHEDGQEFLFVTHSICPSDTDFYTLITKRKEGKNNDK